MQQSSNPPEKKRKLSSNTQNSVRFIETSDPEQDQSNPPINASTGATGIFGGFAKSLRDRLSSISFSGLKDRDVWVELVDSGGKKILNTAKLAIKSNSDFADLCRIVHQSFSNYRYLIDVPFASLTVYVNRNSYDRNQHVQFYSSLVRSAWGRSEQDPIIGIVPESGTERNFRISGNLGFNIEDIVAAEAAAKYQEIATHINGHLSVAELVQKIEQLRSAKFTADAPFIFLEGSSGVGKTQMAINLMSIFDKHEIFYMLASTTVEPMQDIYRYFNRITQMLMTCAKRDYANLNSTSKSDPSMFSCDALATQKLFLFGFICALVEGKYGNPIDFEVHEKSAKDVWDSLLKAGLKKKRPIALLDEYNYYTSELKEDIASQVVTTNANWLRLIRNVFRSVGFVVVTAGTEAKAANLLVLRKFSRRENIKNWCYIYTAFPPVSENCLDQEIWNRIDDRMKVVILNSRPLFATIALKILADADNLTIDDVCTRVFLTAAKIKEFSAHKQSLLGQLVLPLNVSYLVKNSVIANSGTPLIHRHFARLYTSNQTCLVLTNQGKLQNQTNNWVPRTVFPQPCEDALLHLAFIGTKAGNPIVDSQNRISPYRAQVDFFALANRKDFNLNWMNNSVQSTNDGNYLEAILAGVLCIASHANGIEGAPLTKVLSYIAYHISSRPSLRKLGTIKYHSDWIMNSNEVVTEKAISCLSKFADQLIPFLSAPNTKWPAILKSCFNSLSNSERTVNADRIDWKTEACILIQGILKILSGEAKFRTKKVGIETMEKMLLRIPNNSYIHFVLTTRLQGTYFGEKPQSFWTANNLQDTLFIKMTVDNYGNASLSNLDNCFNIMRHSGSKSRPRDYERLVIFIEVPGFDSYPDVEPEPVNTEDEDDELVEVADADYGRLE